MLGKPTVEIKTKRGWGNRGRDQKCTLFQYLKHVLVES